MSYLLLDAVADIGHAYLFLFGFMAALPLIIGIFSALSIISKVISEARKNTKLNKMGVDYDYKNNQDYEENLLISGKLKLEEGYGIISLSEEEKRVLKKYRAIK